MIVMAMAISPPAPMPWTPRKATSSPMFWLRPDSTEPTRNTTMANWKIPLRPNWSESLP